MGVVNFTKDLGLLQNLLLPLYFQCIISLANRILYIDFFFTFLEENIESTPLTTQLSDDEENISNELLEVVVENPDDKV